MQQKEKHNGIEIGTEETESFFAEGDYGYFHDRAEDSEGRGVFAQESLSGLDDLQVWLDGWRALQAKFAAETPN